MTIGAFLDAGLNFGKLSRELARLKLKGYRLARAKVMRGEIAGTKFDCLTDNAPQGHRSLKEIISLINRSSLKERVKDTASKIFNAIAGAEMKVHGKAGAKDIIFHELGDIDSIIDIVGTAIAIDELGIDAVYSSKVNMGRTVVRSRHGNIPVPSPASLELLKGVPISISEIEAELVTPTGAGILKALSKSFGAAPAQMQIDAIGYGAGSKEFRERPNMLRVMIGEGKAAFKEDSVYVIEANIDDMNPQHVGYIVEKLMGAGAADAYITNIQMKKSRPAFKLTAIADASKLQSVTKIIFSETSAIGLRFYEAGRMKLDRKFAKVKTAYGELKVKVSSGPDGLSTVSPEHDECVKTARDKNVPLRKVYEAAKQGASSRNLVYLVLGSFLMLSGLAAADTVNKNNGEEAKGIVVEDYKDRIVLSTANGEKTIMKSDIKELYYDEEEENLIKLADQAKEKKDYIRALTYYDMAYKANPDSKAAKDGLVFLEGYLFRKEQAQKEYDVKRREDLEHQGIVVPTQPAGAEELSEKSARLRKGIGITLSIADGLPLVGSVSPHSSADEAGIVRGDKLTAIWAKLTGYMELREVMDALLDKPSLELKCTIERTVNIPINPYRLIALGANELIGATFAMEFDGLTIASVRGDGASHKSGLKKGDLVIAIDGKPTRYMPLTNAINMIKNSKENTVKLTVRREVLIWRRD